MQPFICGKLIAFNFAQSKKKKKIDFAQSIGNTLRFQTNQKKKIIINKNTITRCHLDG